MSRRHNVFALAARNMEEGRPVEGLDGGSPTFPCWHLTEAAGRHYTEWQETDEVRRFLGAFSDRSSVLGMSNNFLGNIFDSEDERDRCILALCFAAAMADEGDI